MDDEASVDVLSLERERLGALVAADTARARELHADDYQLISPFGDTWSKSEYMDAIESGQLDYRVFEADSDVALLESADAAVLRYIARIEIHSPDGGQDAGRFWHTDIWRLRDGRWQVVWSQATRIDLD